MRRGEKMHFLSCFYDELRDTIAFLVLTYNYML